jgi:hypothetical protein
VAARARRFARVGQRDEQRPAPEWTTESWKHRVEAEARKRLKRGVRGVGAKRR